MPYLVRQVSAFVALHLYLHQTQRRRQTPNVLERQTCELNAQTERHRNAADGREALVAHEVCCGEHLERVTQSPSD